MITTPPLEAKYKAQKKMNDEAQHNLKTYVKNTYAAVAEVEKQYGLKFQYGNVRGKRLVLSPGPEPQADSKTDSESP